MQDNIQDFRRNSTLQINSIFDVDKIISLSKLTDYNNLLCNINIPFLLNLHTPKEGHVCSYLQQRADVLRVPDSNPILG